MTDKKETPEGAPCEDKLDTEEDAVLAKETDADYAVEETNAKEVSAE